MPTTRAYVGKRAQPITNTCSREELLPLGEVDPKWQTFY